MEVSALDIAIDPRIAISSKSSTHKQGTIIDSEIHSKTNRQSTSADWENSQEQTFLKTPSVPTILSHHDAKFYTAYRLLTSEQLDQTKSVFSMMIAPTIGGEHTQISREMTSSASDLHVQSSLIDEKLWTRTNHQYKTISSPDDERKSDGASDLSVQSMVKSYSKTSESRENIGPAITQSFEHHQSVGVVVATTSSPLTASHTQSPVDPSSNFDSNTMKADRTSSFSPISNKDVYHSLILSETSTETLIDFKSFFLDEHEPKELQVLLSSSIKGNTAHMQSEFESQEEETQVQTYLFTTTSDSSILGSLDLETGNNAHSNTVSSQASSSNSIHQSDWQTITDGSQVSPTAFSQPSSEVRASADGTADSNPITEVFMEVVPSSVGSASLLILLIFVLHGPCYRLLQRMRTNRNIALPGNKIQAPYSDYRDTFHEVSRFSEDS